MQIYIWRHSKEFSSWSMLDESHIHTGGYMEAEVVVIAASLEEAYHLLTQVVPLDSARILLSHVR